MKKILFSVISLVMVVGLVGGGAFAYFSDTETSNGNTFTAGTLDITLSGGGTVHNGTQTIFAPCQWGALTFTVTNVGNLPLQVFKYIYNVVGHEGTVVDDPGIAAEDLAQTIAATDMDFDMMVNTVPVIPQANPVGMATVVGQYIYLGQLAPSGVMTVMQSFHLKAAVTNYAQSDYLTFLEDYDALQVVGAGVWTPPAVGTILAALPY